MPAKNSISQQVRAVHTAQHGLVGHHQHVGLPFQLHDHRLQPGHQIFIAFAGWIAIVVLVLVPLGKLLRVPGLEVLVGQTLADTLKFHLRLEIMTHSLLTASISSSTFQYSTWAAKSLRKFAVWAARIFWELQIRRSPMFSC